MAYQFNVFTSNFDLVGAGSSYSLPTASTSVLGGVKIDGTTITIAGGVISAVGGGSGTVTSVSVVTANGVSGSVATATTTPAITLSLGVITPTTVNSITLSGASTPALAVTGTSSISGANTGDQTNISGNAGTVTTNANLTGPITSSGNATAIANSIALPASPTTTTQTPADNSTKIATTAYVDNAVLGQNFKEAVRVATTANLVGTYLNGASGVGATFTYTATGVDTVDGVTLALGNRILLKNQTSDFQNGIYTVTTAGAIGIAGILTRATDADQSGEYKTGDSNFVTAGTVLTSTTWAYTGIDSPTVGTTSLTYVQAAGLGQYTSGNGITVTGSSIAIDTSITVDKTTAQTLTNKTLTSPIMTAPVLGTPASGSAANLTSFPTLNQNTSGTAANLSGTPALPNGTTATTQAAADNSTKLATTAYADTGLALKLSLTGGVLTGAIGLPITSTSTSITLDGTHYTVLVDASGAAKTITLPVASGVTGRIYNIKKTDSTANTVTVDANASELIDGGLTAVIAQQYTTLSIQCDGSNWYII